MSGWTSWRRCTSPIKDPAVIEFVDIAGLVKGASQGAGLGNKFLENIRRTDAIVHVVRCFDDENIMHVVADAGTNVPVDPLGDIETIDMELILADLEMVNRRVEKAAKPPRATRSSSTRRRCSSTGGASGRREVRPHLLLRRRRPGAGGDLRPAEPEAHHLRRQHGRGGLCRLREQPLLPLVRDLAQKEGAQVLPICAKLEQDIAELDDPEERAMFLEDLGIESPVWTG